MANKMNPAQIINPLSEVQNVFVCPGQDLKLTVSDWMGVEDIVCDSNYIELISLITNEKQKVYQYRQVGDFKDWAKASSTLLANIDLYGHNLGSTINVILKSNNKRILGIVEPKSFLDVKITPEQIVEVVFFHEYVPVQITGSPKGLIMVQRGNTEVLQGGCLASGASEYGSSWYDELDLEDAIVLMPRSEFKEYHMCFEISPTSRCALDNLDSGVYYAGSIRFGNHAGVRVHIKTKEQKKKHKPKVIQPTVKHAPFMSNKVTPYHYARPSLCTVKIQPKSFQLMDDDCETMEFDDIIYWKDKMPYVTGFISQYD